MKKALVAIAALALAPLAAAQPTPSAYVTLNFGEANYDVACAPGLSCDEKDKAFKLGLGWQFNRRVAAELAYNDLGQANFTGPGLGAFLHATAYELSAVGTYPLGGVFSALGRVGLAHAKTKYGRDLAGETKSTGLTFGAGTQLDFTKNVAVRLQWQRFDTGEGDVDALMFGLMMYPR